MTTSVKRETAKKIRFTLNGKALEVAEGTLVIDAAEAAGVEVPHYCYHPALGNPGVCRLCMVEVEGMPKLQVSCRLQAKEGMVIRTDSPNARRSQTSSLEFHLVNHPLDCPVCDQAGECWLQDYYMRFGLYASSVREDKEHKQKRLDIGEHVMLDNERCILCTRCVRFLDDVTKTHEFGIFSRGSRSELLPYPGMRVDNPYSGNVVDICPVGALTDKDFRFQVRVWYLDNTPSVCTGCSRGCSIDIHSNTQRPWHAEGRRVARLKPRHNPEVNGWWICDEGRYSYKSVDAPTRLKAASVLENAKPRHVPWSQAAASVATELRKLCDAKGSEGLAVILSGTLSNEDLFAARTLFVDILKADHVLLRPGPDQMGEEDDLLRCADKVPNAAGARALGFGSKIKESSWENIRKAVASGKIWGLYVVDRDPIAVWEGAEAKTLSGLPLSVYQGSLANRFMGLARWVLPSASWVEEEATYVNFEGHVQRAQAAVPPLGEARPDWAIWRVMIQALGQNFSYDSAPQIFNHLGRTEAAFEGLNWQTLGNTGSRMKRRL